MLSSKHDVKHKITSGTSQAVRMTLLQAIRLHIM